MKPEPYAPARAEVTQPTDNADSITSALRAVQVALDRRDNGGDARAVGDQ